MTRQPVLKGRALHRKKRAVVRLKRVEELQKWVEEQIPKYRNRKRIDPMPRPSKEFQDLNKEASTKIGLSDTTIKIVGGSKFGLDVYED